MDPPNNLVVISDTHCGCQLGLCPPEKINLDEGGSYKPSEGQLKLWGCWLEFWGDWVPSITQGEPYDLVHNAELIDGVHHNSTTQISHNLADQAHIARRVMEPIVENPLCRQYYQLRGTEAHSGKSALWDEMIAEDLGAVPEIIGDHKRYARYELWKLVGSGLIHLMHHIGTTGASAYESTAVYKELVESFVEAGRWATRPPDMVIRSHRHRAMSISVPADLATNEAWSVVTPGWQNKTPFAYRIPGARLAPPQFGGVVIRVHSDGTIRPSSKVWTAKRPTPE